MKPRAPHADCANCPARDRSFVPPEPAVQRPARLAIVGEGPGRAEVERKRPFIGASGRALRPLVASIGMQRGHVHWTNAVLCDAREADLEVARQHCLKRLQHELAEVAAPAIVPVGALAAKSVLRRKGGTQILNWRGSVSRIEYLHPEGLSGVRATREAATPLESRVLPTGNASPTPPSPKECDTATHGGVGGTVTGRFAWVLPTIHPAFVMRAPQFQRVIEIDFQRVGRVLRQGFTPPEEQPGREVRIARDMRQLEAGLADMAEGDSGFDVETVGLGPTRTDLVCFGLSDGMLTVVVPWSQGRNGKVPWWPQPAKVAAAVSAFWRKRRVITHNGPAFDHIVAARYGLQIVEWDDTLLAAHAIAPELKKKLSHVVTLGLDVPPWKELEDRTATIERLWIYNARDVLYMTLRWQQADMKGELLQ